MSVSIKKNSSPKGLRLVLILGAMTAFTSMSIDMYLPGFPQMAEDLGVPIGTIQLTVSAFLYGSAIGQIFYGPLTDRYGRRLPLLVGSALYIISTIGCALANSGEALLFWRLVMALGGGAGMVISRAIVRDLYTTAEAARMFSLLMLVMGAAPILAPLVGGQVLLFGGWRGIFFCLTIFGVLCFGAVAKYLPESLPEDRRIKQSLPQLVGLYGQLLQHGQYLCYSIGLGCISGMTISYIAGSPFLFINLHDISPQHFSLFFGVNALGLIGSSQLNRKLLSHYATKEILRGGLMINLASGIILLLSVFTAFGGFPLQVICLFVNVASMGLLYPNITALALAPFKKMAGSASSLMGTIQYLIGATCGGLIGLLQNGTAIPMAAVMTGCAIAALFFAVVLAEFFEPRKTGSRIP